MLLLLHTIPSRALKRGLFSASTHGGLHFPARFFAVLTNRTYDDAIDLLNSVQTQYKVLKQRHDAGIRVDATANEQMKNSLTQIGYSQDDLSSLNIIHVTGTKGKGSTCAYVDSILSQYRKSHDIPKKVGLFTSPHLIAVRERIRINSNPISKELFSKYFFEVWDALKDMEKPVYFRYLTLMSYHAFLREGVDVAVYEVGIGGEYDSTNIVDCPAVTGISSISIDHTFTLGETIEEIAWHKAGIQKPGVPSFTVKQIPAAMAVLKERAEERNVKSFGVVGEDQRLAGVRIRPDAAFQRSNASLAVVLAESVLKKLDPKFKLQSETLPIEFMEGLEKAVWRGRCEKKIEGNVTWYLDGAHTADSILVASTWFGEDSSQRPGAKVLIFNQQGHREAMQLLEDLYTAVATQGLVKFDHVLFCPVSSHTDNSSKKDFVNHAYDSTSIADLTMQKSFAEKWLALDNSSTTTIKVLPSVEAALEYTRRIGSDISVRKGKEAKGTKDIQALITGSMHLVGRALGVLEGVDAL